MELQSRSAISAEIRGSHRAQEIIDYISEVSENPGPSLRERENSPSDPAEEPEAENSRNPTRIPLISLLPPHLCSPCLTLRQKFLLGKCNKEFK